MRKIAVCNVLLRKQIGLPIGLNVPREELGEGWDLIHCEDSKQFKEKIQACGWNLIKIECGLRRSGVGETSDEAISTALRVSLRHISEYFNVVEVDGIELTEYRWFFLARVALSPYRMQNEAVQAVPDDVPARQIVRPQSRLARKPPELSSHYTAALPTLKESLVLSKSIEGEVQ